MNLNIYDELTDHHLLENTVDFSHIFILSQMIYLSNIIQPNTNLVCCGLLSVILVRFSACGVVALEYIMLAAQSNILP